MEDRAKQKDQPVETGSANRNRWLKWLGVLLTLAGFLVLVDAELWRPGAVVSESNNAQVLEAQSWLNGRLDIPTRMHDTARVGDKVYVHFPPMFTLVAMGCIALFGQVPLWCLAILLGLPIPLLAYTLFRRLTGTWHWGALLTLALIFGTSLFPVLDKVLRGVTAYNVNHVLAVIGLLIFLHEFFGRRRVAIAGIGLIIATLSRQLTFAFAIPFIWMAWHPTCEVERTTGRTQPGRRIAIAGLLALAALLPYPILNTLKFGSPLESGYDLIYEGRTDPLAEAAREHGVFSTHFIPRNLWYMNIGPPRVHEITMAGRKEIHIRPSQESTGIWWTTPLLLFLFPALPAIWRDPGQRSLLIGCCLVIGALMLFHNTGALQRGYNRFSLDFVPVLMALVAPVCTRHRRSRWISVILIIWSVVYFRILIPPDPIPDWWGLP